MHSIKHSQNGFTLIEIISVLVILGILAAVAVPKYFDLQEEAEKKAALGSVAEAQTRIQLRFGQALLQGNTCDEAVKLVNNLNLLADTTDDGNLFGEFVLSSDPITTAGVAVSAKRKGNSGDSFDTGAKLYVPECDGTTSNTHSFGNSIDMDTIIKIMQAGKVSRVDSGAVDSSNAYASDAIKAIKEAGIDLQAMGATSWSFSSNKLYWTTSNIKDLDPGTKIPVMAYNTKTGTYTVWSATVSSHTEGTIGTYNRIESESSIYKPAQAAGAANQTYDNALKWFEAASADTSWIK